MIRYIKNNYLLCFLLIPFFKPICFQYFSVLQGLETLFVVWKMLTAVVCLVLVFLYVWIKSKVPKLIIFVFMFEMAIVVSTVLNRGDLVRALIDAVSIVSYTAFLVLEIKYNGRGMVHLLSRMLGILVLINLISVLLFPSGLPADLYTNPENPLYFMVIDNGSALFLTFSIVVFSTDGLLTYGTLKADGMILIISALINALLSGSATAVFTVVLICIAILFIFISDFSKHQNPMILFVIYVAVFIYLITMQDNVVSEFVLKTIFNRSANFTGRYYLWESAINMIKAQPWLGYGRSVHDYISAWGGYFSSHNYVLETLLQGGVIALVLYVLTVIYAIKKSLYTRHCKITACIVCGLMAVLIAALMEATVHSVYIFGSISLCAGSWYLEKEQEKRKVWIGKSS